MKSVLDSSVLFQGTFEMIEAMRHEINAFCSGDGRWEALQQEISQIANDRTLSQVDELKSLLARVEHKQDLGDYSLEREEAEAMLASCDSFRFRMTSVALGAKQCLYRAGANAQTWRQRGATIRAAGGVAYARFDDNMIILLPDIDSCEANNRVMEDLLEIFDSFDGYRSNWMVDFSSVTHTPPVMLMGVLKGYMDELQQNGGTIMLSWLRASLFNPSFFAILEKTFNLKEIGGYYFSREVEC